MSVARVDPDARIFGPVELGEDVFVGHFVTISAWERIRIGARTMVAAGTYIIDHDHDTAARDMRPIGKVAAIEIGADCWIGGNVCVLKGVTLGDGCVVGAGAVVTRSAPANTVLVGNPARPLRTRVFA